MARSQAARADKVMALRGLATLLVTLLVVAGAPASANEVQGSQTLTVAKGGDGTGTVTSEPAGIDCGTDCSEPYAEQTSVTLTATSAAGSGFFGWSGDCTGVKRQCTVLMSQARSVTADFSSQLRMLNVTLVGPGRGTVESSPFGIECGPDCANTYPAGEKVTLIAFPSSGSGVGDWTGCDSQPSDIECVVTMDTDHDVSATFISATHERAVSLSLRKHLVASGRVSVPDGFDECAREVYVAIQRRQQGRWKMVTLLLTADDGSFRGRLPDRTGRYRAVATKHEIPGTALCLKATSEARSHRH